eukprot:CAMPEP_0204227714 /NCGR_PEP_ID=MMETSP0361-20130328/85904_1 /ASSEMBLY_ACC=CAM_ASM_000343 /TAXON_ID=268821 /ORGANISM="Scrippsiella Hangoei, Strain SHTV-5" /LENGTH=34 /DNA_ID= /DNA_START= /DNA_END= /DNA_ORIENTATION=
MRGGMEAVALRSVFVASMPTPVGTGQQRFTVGLA